MINGKTPRIDKSVFVAPNATVIGNVSIGANSSVWFGAIVRGDSNSIKIGERTNVQDMCILHVDHKNSVSVGDDVTIGHRALLHGCVVKDRVLVGMGSTVMNGAVIGEDSIVGAGALVTEGMVVPPRSLVLGIPAKVKRELTPAEAEGVSQAARHYLEYVKMYR